jgi:tetratricopeptide (TPR) repeat protein/predicted Ser/Thr protein kinase
MRCLDDLEVLDYVEQRIDEASSAGIRAHLDACDNCLTLVTELAQGTPARATIGRYRIETVVGTGAMGIVYEAVDPQLDRRVAIKVLRTPGDTGGHDRLLQEARAIAQISHPNVIAVYDAGVADHEVFIAMELIRGRTLRAWAGERARGWAEIVETVALAGRGLAAVHAAGLTHRDVKPDNVLVASTGDRTLITDFGLVRVDARAGALEHALAVTQTGAVVGTPAYLAPEVIDGTTDADPRADQFSFCVMLHELLAGERPFGGASLAELRAAIDRGPPAIARVPATISAAVARGLAVDPAARWPSIDALVAQLVRATRPNHARWLVTGGVAIATIAAIGGVLATRGNAAPHCDAGASTVAAVWNSAIRERLAGAFAHTNLSYAASAAVAVATSIDRYATQLAAGYDDACAATHERQAQSEALLDVRVQCLDRRRGELAALLAVLATSDVLHVDTATSAVAGLVSPDVCADSELLAKTEPMPDAPALRLQVEATAGELARVKALSDAGHYADAMTLGVTVAATAARLGYPPLIAEAEQQRARTAIDLQQWAEAKAALEAALVAAERGRHHRLRGDVHLALAYLATKRNEPEQALVQVDLAGAIVDGLGGVTQNRARVADYRGQALTMLGRLDDAKRALDSAVELYTTSEGPDTISLANPLTNLAYVAHERGDVAGAVKLLTRVLELQQRALGADHPRVGIAHVNLAFNLSAADQLAEAERHAEAARTLLTRAGLTTSEPYAQASRALVDILRRRGEYGKAEQVARAVVASLEKLHGPATPPVASAMSDLAAVLSSQGRHGEALAIRAEVLAINQRTLPPQHPDVVATMIDHADSLTALARWSDALAAYEQAAPLADGPEMPPYLAIAARLGRGRCLVELGRGGAAVKPLREALTRNAEPAGTDDLRLRGWTEFVLARALPAGPEATKLLAAARADATTLHDPELGAALATWSRRR